MLRLLLSYLTDSYFTWTHKRTDYIFLYDLQDNGDESSASCDCDCTVHYSQKEFWYYCYQPSVGDIDLFKESKPKTVRKIERFGFPHHFVELLGTNHVSDYIFTICDDASIPNKLLYTSELCIPYLSWIDDDVEPICYAASHFLFNKIK